MKIVFNAILLLGTLIAVSAKPFAEPFDESSDESMEVLSAAGWENEDKLLNTMMNHIVASVMQSNDDGSDSMMMEEDNVSDEQRAKLQFWRLVYGPYIRYLGKK